MTININDVLQLIVLILVVVGALYRFSNEIKKDFNKLRDDLNEHQLKMPIDYVRNDDFREYKKHVSDDIHEIKEIIKTAHNSTIVCHGPGK